MLYLDNAASSPVRPEVLEAMWPYLSGVFGNPASHHELGEQAARTLAAARAETAALLGCRPGEIVYTSGGTESNNLAIKGIALASPRDRRMVTTLLEHEAVLESADYLRRLHGFRVELLPVDGTGLVGAEALRACLDGGATLVSIALANNEVGTVQPIAALAALAREAGVPIHTDAVQAAGWLPIRLDELGVDALSISGHKLGTPKGIGLLAVRSGLPLEPLVHGGGQQRGRRSGTENVAAAVGLATALRLAEEERAGAAARVAALRETFIAEVLHGVPGARLTGHPSQRLPALASFCFPGTSGEAVLLELERRGVVCSSGSACAAGSSEPSAVLTALGIEAELAQTAVRFSFDHRINADQLARAAAAVTAAVAAVSALR